MLPESHPYCFDSHFFGFLCCQIKPFSVLRGLKALRAAALAMENIECHNVLSGHPPVRQHVVRRILRLCLIPSLVLLFFLESSGIRELEVAVARL